MQPRQDGTHLQSQFIIRLNGRGLKVQGQPREYNEASPKKNKGKRKMYFKYEDEMLMLVGYLEQTKKCWESQTAAKGQ